MDTKIVSALSWLFYKAVVTSVQQKEYLSPPNDHLLANKRLLLYCTVGLMDAHCVSESAVYEEVII